MPDGTGSNVDRTVFSILADDHDADSETPDQYDVTLFDQIDNIESSTPGEPGDGEEKEYALRQFELVKDLDCFLFVANASMFLGELVTANEDRPGVVKLPEIHDETEIDGDNDGLT